MQLDLVQDDRSQPDVVDIQQLKKFFLFAGSHRLLDKTETVCCKPTDWVAGRDPNFNGKCTAVAHSICHYNHELIGLLQCGLGNIDEKMVSYCQLRTDSDRC